MPSLTLKRPASQVRTRPAAAIVLAAALAIAVVILVTRLSQDMPRRDVTFSNPTRWAIEVQLILGSDDSRVSLGTIGAHDTVTFEEVGTPGSEWTFEFAAWDASGTVAAGADEVRAGITVPASLVARLESLRPPASPFG